VVTGVAMVSAGLTPVQALGMSLLVYAGSAQLAIVPLLAAGAPLWVIFATALMVNLRYVIYSAVLAPHFRDRSRLMRVVVSYLIIDGLFATFVARYQAKPHDPGKHWFYLGGSITVYLAWQLATAVGVFAGAVIPAGWSLEFAATLALIGLVVPLLYDRAVVAGAAVSGVVALLTRSFPLNLGIVVSIAAGVAAGLLASAVLRLDRTAEAP
jgi:predicted branched-subunit amino acid permease